MQAIAEGRYEEAHIIARAPNPFASICGRVCAAPCEAKCRRGALDASISIRALKRLRGDERLQAALLARYGRVLERGVQGAIIKDETLCIRCGLCAARCPTGTITMERAEQVHV